jgi:16S rRNA (cytosine1407-C5)-methyltransferase
MPKADSDVAVSAASASNLPQEFIKRLREIFPEQFGELVSTFVERPLAFRINPSILAEQALQQLTTRGFTTEQVFWLPGYYILRSGARGDFSRDPLVVDGKLYIQSLASAAVGLALGAKPGEVVLDLAAAPGSKTSQIAIALAGQGRLVANDSSKPRFFRMLRNLELQGLYKKGGEFLRLELQDGVALARRSAGSFDKVLLDAPCSGESRFIIGDKESLGFWNKKKIKINSDRQRRLIVAAFGALKIGGELLYSTCTIAPEENEFIVQHLLNRVGDAAQILSIEIPDLRYMPPAANLPPNKVSPNLLARARRIYPSVEIESFFMAKIRRLR